MVESHVALFAFWCWPAVAANVFSHVSGHAICQLRKRPFPLLLFWGSTWKPNISTEGLPLHKTNLIYNQTSFFWFIGKNCLMAVSKKRVEDENLFLEQCKQTSDNWRKNKNNQWKTIKGFLEKCNCNEKWWQWGVLEAS